MAICFGQPVERDVAVTKQLVVISPPGERLIVTGGRVASVPAPDDDYTYLIVEDRPTVGRLDTGGPALRVDDDDDDDAPVFSMAAGRPRGIDLAMIAGIGKTSGPLTRKRIKADLSDIAEGGRKVIVLGRAADE